MFNSNDASKDLNGKIDRPSLPFPNSTDLAILNNSPASITADMTDSQKRLAKVWASVLPSRSAQTFGPKSNFFDEGGHSILAQQMFFQIRKEWEGINLPVNLIFQSQTLEALAEEIDRSLNPIGLRLDAMPLPRDNSVKDEAYAADAKDLIHQLPPSIPTRGTGHNSESQSTGSTVLLTGATGFLGSYILRELLNGPIQARVIAHVRAKDREEGLSRLKNTIKAYGLWSSNWESTGRLDAVVGDISKPNLGLEQNAWDSLVNEVDVVVHNGAQVNWMLPYSRLRAVNVLSTLDCIKFCASGKPKRLAFISSTSTLDCEHFIQLTKTETPVLESDDLKGSSKGLATGYGQSKWTSEYIVREAGRRGLVGAIIRPGYIVGDPESGISVSDDFLVRLWKGCLQINACPDIPNTLNAVPVTQVSRIIVAATFHLDTVLKQPLGVAQITSHPRITLNNWTDALAMYGYPAPTVPYREWATKVQEYVGSDAEEDHALLPLFHFVVGDLPTDTIAPSLDDSNAAQALRLYQDGDKSDSERKETEDQSPLAGNAVTMQNLGTYLAYLVAIGFLPSPPSSKAAKYELPSIDANRLQDLAAGRVGGRSARP